MAYKRYFKINGKTYGPYYYESYRDKAGKVRKKYVKLDEVEGKDSSRGKGFNFLKFSFIFLLLGFFVAGVFFVGSFYGFTGKVVDEVGSEGGLVGSLEEELVDSEEELVDSLELVVGSEEEED